MAERIDGVVVAGAGPVGLVIALKLARAGVRVLVVDAAPRIIEEPRAVVYHSPVVERPPGCPSTRRQGQIASQLQASR